MALTEALPSEKEARASAKQPLVDELTVSDKNSRGYKVGRGPSRACLHMQMSVAAPRSTSPLL
jgi:hypothetical protein